MREYLEFKDDKSSKFWSIELEGKTFTVVYGKIGSTGKADVKSFASESEAEKEANKLLNSKLKKGYERADAPDSHGEGAKIKAQEKSEKKKPEAKQDIVAPEDVADDGKIHPWQSKEEDFWDDGFDDETFGTIREPESVKPAAKGPEKDVVGKFDEKEYSRHLHKMEDSGRFARLNEFLKELEIVKQYAVMADKIEPEKNSYYMPVRNLYKYNLTATLKWIFDNISFKADHIKIIEILLKEGADFESVAKEEIDECIGDPFWDERIHPMWMNFVERYRQDPDYTKTALYFEEYLTGLFKKSTDIAIKLVNNLIEEIKSGKHPKYEGQTTLPKEIRGLKLYIHDYDKVIVYGIKNTGNTTLAEEELKGINDFDESLVSIYALDYLKSKFEEVDKTELDSISSGIMQVMVEGIENPLYESKVETENKELLEKAQLLENTEEWEKKAELIDEVTGYLVYQKSDPDRALRIIKRFLYSGNGNAEEKARKALERYDDGAHRTAWWFERAVYWWDNMDYDWSLRTIKRYALDEKYPPAVEFYQKQLADGVITAGKKGKDSDEEDDDDYYTDEFGYGNEARVQEFLDKFTEEDKFRETDNVVMRAYSNSRVYIYFKKESEKAYEEALDFLLHLISKGYVTIFEGYQLCVRFVAKPEFIPKVGLPATQCNAFFARAVRYESLHDRIRQYVLTGMNMFDGYHDLDGDERCTVVGAFAASALALADRKHLDLAIRYGKQSDGEHEETQLELAYALEKVYGVDKDTAPAIYELIISYDHAENKVKDTFYKDAEVLEAFTKYLYGDDSHFKEGKIVRFMGSMFPKGGLKVKMNALKAYYDNATDARIKNIYADFYNLVIDSDAALSYSKLSLEPLAYAGVEATKKEKAYGLELKEDKPVVIDIKEAKKRGLDDNIISKSEGRYSNVFSPPVLTDPRFLELLITEHNRRSERDIYNKIGVSGSGWNCLYQLDNKWVIDLSVAPYQYGIFIYNGKDKPVVLYGALKSSDLLLKMGKRKIKDDEVEALMEEYAVPGIETPKGSPMIMPEPPILAIMDQIRMGLFDDRFCTALINIEKIKPEDGEYYKSAQIFKAYILELKLKNSRKSNLVFDKDKEELKKLYSELQQLLPEYDTYWQEKIAKFV
ncbi:WGR domain-containing protein [Dysgonomonas sp. 521]|uniref:DUF6138 family protein n=1 Tax=Dysgonomonas sp. 521 TaxID=2302932 RepID=UPI0013D5768F|nr:DUF6138 family protein [Dysgonomonas sp. 521]NDV97024.1 WGR domain-containing protein [Dysgonomonas sp. 521]